MTVPIDRLYDFLHAVCDKDILIYRWLPHGSRKLIDLLPIKNLESYKQSELLTKVHMICHDQEPLHFDLWTKQEFLDLATSNMQESPCVSEQFSHWHLRTCFGFNKANLYEKTLLCHSERNSKELEKYENQNFIGVYYWSHALLARDWFRHAAVDPCLTRKINSSKIFLAYNRAWTGSREYRLKFSELLFEHNLLECCLTSFNATDGYSYRNHVFANNKLQINNWNLENHFAANFAPAWASADYHAPDYQTTQIEIVLETLFDDCRHHLTEKSLRPIACGQPFILCASPGSLTYLRNYGFSTFDSVIDESYDRITDPLDRLQAIMSLMQQIKTSYHKTKLITQLQNIAAYNQKRFFSNSFQQQVIDEFKNNFVKAFDLVLDSCTGTNYQQYMQAIKKSGRYLEMKIKRDGPDSINYVDLEQKILDDHMSRLAGRTLHHPNPLTED